MNQYQCDLIEDPPPKNPYFTLPSPKFFLTPEDIRIAESFRPVPVTLVDLFGPFDKMSDDEQSRFLLTLMQHSGFVPNYDAMAQALNATNSYQIRRRFIAIAEKQGFKIGSSAGVVDSHDAHSAERNHLTSSVHTSMPQHGSLGGAPCAGSTTDRSSRSSAGGQVAADSMLIGNGGTGLPTDSEHYIMESNINGRSNFG